MLRVDKDKASGWSESEVIRRWKKLCKIPELVKMHQKNPESPGISFFAQDEIEKWRKRLMDISWFMRFMNEYLARRANEEDNCSGRFYDCLPWQSPFGPPSYLRRSNLFRTNLWEGRFKSQPLLDEAAVLTAMSYVDLNPIRSKMAKTPETSDYTSIQQRIQKLRGKTVDNNVPLMALSASNTQSHKNSIAFSPEDYLQLVDWAGRAILKNKRGYIDASELPILQRLNIDAEGFMELMTQQDDLSQLSVMGSTAALSHYMDRLEKKFVKGLTLNQRLFA